MAAEPLPAAMFPFGFHLPWGFTEKAFTTATNASRTQGSGPVKADKAAEELADYCKAAMSVFLALSGGAAKGGAVSSFLADLHRFH